MTDFLVQGYTDFLDGKDPELQDQEYLYGYFCQLVNSQDPELNGEYINTNCITVTY
jgi:hypothetical protein